jgi:hypothetical protein
MSIALIRSIISFAKKLVVISMAINLVGCEGDCSNFDRIKTRLEHEIKIGDTRQKVEEILKGSQLDYSYDGFQNRFQSTARDSACGKWVALSIYVSFDEMGLVSKVEVFRSYTGL